MLAMIPLLAIIFAIAKGFGMEMLIEDQLRQMFYGQKDLVDTLTRFINSYLAHTKSGVFVGVGILVLIYSVLQLAISIENIFNEIWKVERARSLSRKVADYGAFILLLPVVMIVMSGLSILVSQLVDILPGATLWQPVYRISLLVSPFLLAGVVFTGVYVVIPNTVVKLKYALFPGFLAGCLFQLSLYLYINTQLAVSSYNAIYGSFAAIPIFMVWAGVAWNICLFGAVLSYALQNFTAIDRMQLPGKPSRRYHDFLCALLLGLIGHRFRSGNSPYTVIRLAVLCRLSVNQTQELLNELEEKGLVYKHKEDKAVWYIPAMSTERLTVERLAEKLEAGGFENAPELRNKYARLWRIYIEDYMSKAEHKECRLDEEVG